MGDEKFRAVDEANSTVSRAVIFAGYGGVKLYSLLEERWRQIESVSVLLNTELDVLPEDFAKLRRKESEFSFKVKVRLPSHCSKEVERKAHSCNGATSLSAATRYFSLIKAMN